MIYRAFVLLFGTTALVSVACAFSAPNVKPPKTSQGPPPGVGGPPPGTPGGPPTSMGGPPPGVGGPPPGTPGGTPPGVGGPPKGAGGPPGTAAGPGNTAAPAWLETAFEVAFKLFYLGDETVIDSSKNLRVLWTRALLANLGKVDDAVAFDLLPSKSRWVVGQFMADAVWKDSEAVKKLDWIVDRTKFIDGQLTEFLKETASAPKRQVIVLGSGYDTRA